MSIVTTNREIDLVQLDAEIAAAAGLTGPPGLTATTTATSVGFETVVHCDNPAVTQTILDNTIDTHTPAPPPPSPEAVLQSQLDELTDYVMGM